METESTYRPRNAGHDYYDAGIYLITLVVSGREPRLGTLNMDIKSPGMIMSDVGRMVWTNWHRIPEFQAKKGRIIKVLAAVCMPEHFHGVLLVEKRMDVSIGEAIRSFKSGCTMGWRELQQRTVGNTSEPNLASQTITEREKLQHMSHKQRALYYAQQPRTSRPLFDDNYDDTVCLSQRHLEAMVHYVDDNPRRAIIRRLKPDFMRRCLHIRIGGHDYAAFGNLFLLRWANKEQVFCHRKARLGQLTEDEKKAFGVAAYADAADSLVTSVPYEQTAAYKQECKTWITHILDGATVLVTPGISAGERIMKNVCLESGFPLIHLQKEPIGSHWKPKKMRFEACTRGALLILAPWQPERLGTVNGITASTDYSIYHNLNDLAAHICAFYGEASIVND